MIAIGAMSGTSCDGIDVVAIDLRHVDEPHEPKLLEHVHVAYEPEFSETLRNAASLPLSRAADLHREIGERHADAIARLSSAKDAAVIGMHGQTVWHAPPSREARATTLQLGSGAVLAVRVGVPVVSDLRMADVARGGEGAPLVPFAHWFFTAKEDAPRAIVNFGGICNVSLVAADRDEVSGWDVGPGMMLSDAFARRASDGARACDEEGSLSAAGSEIEEIVKSILGHPFLGKKPPKSTGREEFGADFADAIFRAHGSAKEEDIAYSLLCGSAEALRIALAPFRLREVLITGGGARNPTLIRILRARFGSLPVRVATEGVFSPECHEPAAMALIAARTLHRLPSSLPRVTGARAPSVLGQVHWP